MKNAKQSQAPLRSGGAIVKASLSEALAMAPITESNTNGRCVGMLLKIPSDLLPPLFKLLDKSIKEKGSIKKVGFILYVVGDAGSGELINTAKEFDDIPFPTIEITRSDVEQLKQSYTDHILAYYRYPDLYVISCDQTIKFCYV